MTQPNQLLIVDGMSLLFRGYFATAYGGYIRKTSTGIPTNAIYGFVRYLWDAIETFAPSHVLCCWDMGSKTFRTDMYSPYKANRSEPPEELIPQFDLVKEVVSSFDIPNIGLKGYEADDCIGTIATQHCQDIEVRILTGDHDSLQLINDRIYAIIMKKGMSNYEVYSPQKLLDEKGLTPTQFIDLKGLMGDTSDNYPGVKGIGEKTAIKLLQQYDSIDGILTNLSSLSQGVRKKIEAELDMLQLSRQLAAIKCDVPISIDLDECKFAINQAKLQAQFERLEFQSLLKQIS